MRINYFLIKGGSVRCFWMAGKFGPEAFKDIVAALAEEEVAIPQAPVSCVSLLAKNMGLSDKQSVMAAGLAGGIGLSGGACGALGAIIWIKGLETGEDQKLGFNDPASLELIERFLVNSDYEFECSEIVGRKFENVADHANHVGCGGCKRIIGELALT